MFTSTIQPFLPLPLRMWTSPSSPNSIPSSCSILANDTNTGNPNRFPKSMEEIWKDITLSSLHHATPGTHHNPSRGMILQEFLTKDPPHSASPPHPTVLTLSSAPHPQDHRAGRPHVSPLSLPPFEGLQVPDHKYPACGKKRFPDSERISGDRRHKRMIKNRESAARSRARKQAYTNELELEVAHLLEENARLKKQQQQSSVAAADDHGHAKKKPLQRASTAPF